MNRLPDEVCAARLPLEALPRLASLRGRPGVRIAVDGDRAWLRWTAGDAAVFYQVFSVAGADFFAWRDGQWYPSSSRLPIALHGFDSSMRPLEREIFPQPVQPQPPPVDAVDPVELSLVHDRTVRKTTAMRCPLAALGKWIEQALSADLSGIRAARTADDLLLLGPALPWAAESVRYWGDRLLVPLGFRVEPAFGETTLLEACGIGEDEIAVFDRHGMEVVPELALAPLTRADYRLALGGAT
jgi:hypothetical protein